uniref:Purine nucleoside phosphorylase n=1 Tax=Desulfatirhabdium butyrativorans TaxID=340467 RepID=A0A7C4W173_9BACT
MVLKSFDGLAYYQFPHLDRYGGVVHGVFTRKGGVSQGPYESLNVAIHNGDRVEDVRENRRRMTEALGGDVRLVCCSQVHGDGVHVLSRQDIDSLDERRIIADALITDIPGIVLVIQVADCQPVLLFDPKIRVIANVHSGWRGSIANIVGKTVRVMQERFGSKAEHIRAGIGPSLGPCCAEFIHYRTEIPETFWSYRIDETHFDFWRLTRDQLMAEGVLEDHIEDSGMCTRCCSDLFFSYRRQKVTGRFAAVILLR